MKKSIISKINRLLAISLITLSFFIIAVNIFIIYKTSKENFEILVSTTCGTQAAKLNNQIKLVEQAVNNIYSLSEKNRPSIEELSDPDSVKKFLNDFEDAAIAIAENTDGAMALYYRMNPELTGDGKSGFFYVRANRYGRFNSSEITDLYEYEQSDAEHVRWYYNPISAGRPVWMTPYYNANINIEMISYVIPIFEGNTAIGVVGIDIDFNTLKSIAEDVDIYKSNGAVLCNMSGRDLYYIDSTLFGNKMSDDLYNALQKSDSSKDISIIEVNGEEYGVYFQMLDNRMKLMLYAKKSDIYSDGNTAIYISLIIFVVLFVATLYFSMVMGKRIVKPIVEITDATREYAEGNWDVKVTCDTKDELQLLTEHISLMAEKTKKYIGYINDMAKKDGLTGLRNKMAYLMYVDMISNEYLPNDKPFAVSVFDVNNLKKVNDTYGHEKGDELILLASKCICERFAHSPVFRIGGDEFVAIIDGEDYRNCDELVCQFKEKMMESKNSDNIMDVIIACGLAKYGEDGMSYENIFKVADQRMYENKAEIKGVKKVN